MRVDSKSSCSKLGIDVGMPVGKLDSPILVGKEVTGKLVGKAEGWNVGDTGGNEIG